MAVGFAVTQAFNSPGASQYGGGGQAINGNGGAASGGIGGGGGGLLTPPNAPTLTLTSNANDNMPDFLATAAAADLPVGATVQLSAFTNSGLTGSPAYTGFAVVTVAGTLALVNTMGPLLDATYWYVAVTAIPGHAVSARSNTVTNTIDTVAPVLSGATSTATGSTTASGTVVTNEASGTLYWIADTGGTPTATQVKAGQGATGAAANGQAANQAVTATGTQNILATTLTTGTTYTFYFAQQDAAGNLSAVAASAAFTTTGATGGAPLGLLLALSFSSGGGGPPPPFSPTDISGLVLWMNATGNYQDTARTTAAAANNDPIGSLTDHSSVAHHGTQAVAGQRPLLKTNAVGTQSAISFDGVNDVIGLSGGPTLGAATTWFIVAKKSSAASAYILSCDGAAARDPAVLSNFFGGGRAFSWFNDNSGSDQIDYPDLIALTKMHILCFIQTDASSLKCRIDSGLATAWSRTPPTSTVTGRSLLALGGNDPAATANTYGGLITNVLVYNSALSDTDRAKVEDYLANAGGGGRAVYIGDSLTMGQGSSPDAEQSFTSYTCQISELLSVPWIHGNFGVGGDRLTDMMARTGPIDALYPAPRCRGTCVVWGGTNDLYFGDTVTNTYNNFVSLCQARRAVGWRVVAVTMLSRSNSGTPGTFNTDRATFNTNVRANWSTFADALADVAADPNIGPNGAETNLTYFSGDNCHMNATGYGVVASIVLPQL